MRILILSATVSFDFMEVSIECVAVCNVQRRLYLFIELCFMMVLVSVLVGGCLGYEFPLTAGSIYLRWSWIQLHCAFSV